MANTDFQESEREQASPILRPQSEYDENRSVQRSGYGDLPHITSNGSQSISRAEREERLAHALGWLSIGLGLAEIAGVHRERMACAAVVGDVRNDHVEIDFGSGERPEDAAGHAGQIGNAGDGDPRHLARVDPGHQLAERLRFRGVLEAGGKIPDQSSDDDENYPENQTSER